MKYLSLFFIISILYQPAFANKFTVITDDSEIDFSSLDKNILVKIEKNEFPQKYLTAIERDAILERHVSKFYNSVEDFERELFYNDLFNYSHKKLKAKYSFLNEKIIIALKKDFLKK